MDWQPIETAPRDREILAWCGEWQIAVFCQYSVRHGGWIDELCDMAYPTHWINLEPPK